AKDPLLRVPYELGDEEGATCPVHFNNECIGFVVRTQSNVKPVFVSAGHLISQKEAVSIILELRGKYRTIEPIRRADQAARKFAKGMIEEETWVLE
ncbi:MAG: endonuclease V, partial [Bacteroidota bacterium]